MFSSTHPLNSALDGGGWSTPRLGRLTPGGKPATHFIGGWVGLRGRSGRLRKIRPPPPPTGIRYPDRPARGESLYRLRNRGPRCSRYYYYYYYYLQFEETGTFNKGDRR
jgi:hypothetical protein